MDLAAAAANIGITAPGLLAKLRIAPSQAGLKNIAAHMAVLEYASTLKASGYEIIKIEAKVEDGFKAEADIVANDPSKSEIYIDVTTTTDSDIMALKIAKAKQISETEKINYVVRRVHPAVVPKINYKCKFEGPCANLFEILENTASSNLSDLVVKKRTNQMFSSIVKAVSTAELLKPDMRWTAVPIDYVQSNSAAAVSDTLGILSDNIPELRSFIGKLQTMAGLSKKTLFYLQPADTIMLEPHPLIKALKMIPKESDAYAIKSDYTLDLVGIMPKANFVDDPSVIAIAKRKYIKLTNTFVENRYIIKFNRDYIGSDMAAAIDRTTNKVKSTEYSSTMFKDLPETKVDNMSSILASYNAISEYLTMSTGASTEEAADLYVKMITLCSNDSGLLDADSSSIFSQSRELIAQCIAAIRDTVAGQILSHYHEVAKSIAASIGKSARRNEYFIGRNGNYNSYVIVKCTATQDSFKSAPYLVFYKPKVISNSFDSFFSKARSEGEYLITNRKTATKNVVNWHIKLPYVVVNLIAWHMEQNQNVLLNMPTPTADFVSSCTIFSVINRDPFAQVADLTRYWYGSSIGDDADILGLIKKYDTFIAKYFTEVVYIARQLKMAASLRSYKVKNYTKFDVKDSQGSMAIALVMPHLDTVIAENSATISMFYISNVFNKFKYNVEVSSAICFLQLKEELDIYNKSNPEYKNGISDFNINVTKLQDILNDDVRFEEELKFINRLMLRGANRFQCSIVATYLFSLKFGPTVNVDELYLKLAEAPVDALTMRGGMDNSDLSESSQSIRAASTMIEGIIDAYGRDPEEFNASTYSKANIMADLKNADVSIYALKLLQFAKPKLFAYRIVHKDQKGHREISVMNYNMRVATFFLEHIFKHLARSDDTDLLQNPDKLRVVQKYIREIDYKTNKVVFDTTDQSRWGPNVLLHHFAAMTTAVLDADTGLVRMALDSLEAMTLKKAKIPDSIMALIHAQHTKFNPLSAVGKCMSLVVPMITEKKYALDMIPGMGQGILHQVSSTLHVIKRKVVAHILGQIVPSVKIKDNTTSDDNTTILTVPKGLTIELDSAESENKNKISLEKIYLTVNSFMDNVFNIIRNTSKSFLSRRLMDFNSSFYSEECLAVPTLKQRISYIDCGEGEDMLADLVTASSTGASYLLSGGSYMGAVMLSITNTALVMDQHRAWYKYKQDARPMSERSVFAMGIPVIEPLITLLYGPLTSIILREMKATGLPAKVILTALFNNITAPSEMVEQKNMLRGESKIHASETFKYMLPSNISGLISLFRPQKLQSRFIRRHKFNFIPLDEELIHYRKTYPSFTNFLFTASIGVGTKVREENLGINNFLIRYTEPWIALDAKKYIVSNSRFAQTLYKTGRLSLREHEIRSSSITNEEIIATYESTANAADNELADVITNVLIEFMDPAKSVMDLLCTHAIKPVISTTTYSHVKVLLPHKLAGESSDIRKALIRKLYTGNNRIFFNNAEDISFGLMLESKLKDMATDSLKDAILSADLLYNSIVKYARVKTVGIAKSKSDIVKYENIVNIYLGKMFTSTMSIDLDYKMDALTAPLSYVTLNKAVQTKLNENRDKYSKMIVHSVTGLEFDNIFDEVFIKSEKPILQNCQSIVEFVKYHTDTVFKLNSSTLRSFSEELLALAGFAGSLTMTKAFFSAMSSGMLASTTLADCNGMRSKILKSPYGPLVSLDGFPATLVNELSPDGYKTTLLVMAPEGINSTRFAIDLGKVDVPAWQKKIFKSIDGLVIEGAPKVIARSAAGLVDMFRVKFISEVTKFKLETISATGNFFLTDGEVTLPMKTNLIFNRRIIHAELIDYTWPNPLSNAVANSKSLADITSELLPLLEDEGEHAIQSLLDALNSISYPVSSESLETIINKSFITDRPELTIFAIAEAIDAKESLINYPDIFVAFLIIGLKAYFDINIRKSTLVRTMLKPMRSSKEAPLFSLKPKELRAVKAGKMRMITNVTKLAIVPESVSDDDPVGLNESDIDEEERKAEEEFAILMKEDLANARAKRKAMAEVEPSDAASGTIFTEDYIDYKAMTGDMIEEETRYDTMLVTSNNAIEAVLEDAKSIAESLIMRFARPGYKILEKTQFHTTRLGIYNSTLMSLLSDASKNITASAFAFLLLS